MVQIMRSGQVRIDPATISGYEVDVKVKDTFSVNSGDLEVVQHLHGPRPVRIRRIRVANLRRRRQQSVKYRLIRRTRVRTYVK